MVSSAMAITAEDLTKNYGATTALNGLNLQVPTGTVLGLLGPNGALAVMWPLVLVAVFLPLSVCRYRMLSH